MNIAICICTYKRPEGLERFLNALEKLDYDQGVFELFIAENDPDLQAGYKKIQELKENYCFPIYCDIELQPGISYARNKSLQLIKQSDTIFDYVAFTDDDTEPNPYWLKDLVRTSLTYNAEMVSGKMEPLFEFLPGQEVLESVFYQNHFSSPGTGTNIISASTCNLLIKKDILDTLDLQVFDIELATFGGEDVSLVTRLLKKGYKLVKCSTGVVYETFPANRLTRDWVIQRYYRYGCTYGYIL